MFFPLVTTLRTSIFQVAIITIASTQMVSAGYLGIGAHVSTVGGSYGGTNFSSTSTTVDRVSGPVRFQASTGALWSTSFAGPYVGPNTRLTFGSSPTATGTADMNIGSTIRQLPLYLEQNDLFVTQINGVRFPILRVHTSGTIYGSLAPGDSAYIRAGWGVYTESPANVVVDIAGNRIESVYGAMTITNSGTEDLSFIRNIDWYSSMFGPNVFAGDGVPSQHYRVDFSLQMNITRIAPNTESWIGTSNLDMDFVAVPEPSSLAFGITSLLGIFGWKTRSAKLMKNRATNNPIDRIG